MLHAITWKWTTMISNNEIQQSQWQVHFSVWYVKFECSANSEFSKSRVHLTNKYLAFYICQNVFTKIRTCTALSFGWKWSQDKLISNIAGTAIELVYACNYGHEQVFKITYMARMNTLCTDTNTSIMLRMPRTSQCYEYYMYNVLPEWSITFDEPHLLHCHLRLEI